MPDPYDDFCKQEETQRADEAARIIVDHWPVDDDAPIVIIVMPDSVSQDTEPISFEEVFGDG